MNKEKLQTYDFALIFTPILLSLFGVVMVYSTSMVWAVMVLDGTPDLFFKKQLMWFFLSLSMFLVFLHIPYRFYMRLRKLIFFGSPFILLYVLFAGKVAGNAQSWISFAGINFQPAEAVKLALIIYLSAVFSKKQAYIKRFWPAFGPPLMFTGIIFVLIFLQPDLGTGLLLLCIAFVITVCAGIQWRHLMILTAVGIVGALLMIPALSDVQMSRFSAAYDPFHEDRINGQGYQLVNSYYAIASGGLMGKGLGNSIQKYGYLPEPHTDFIISLIAEELGIFGLLFVFLSLAYIVIKGYQIAVRHPDPFAGLLAIGISTMIGLQAFINLGSATGILPITGVTLPFVSYGGSSLLFLMISIGILNNISRNLNVIKRSSSIST